MSDVARPESEATPRSLGLKLLVGLPVAVFAGLAALFAIRLGAGDPSRLPSALIGRQVPAFDLPALDGAARTDGRPLPGLASRDLAAGQVTVVNVWASWCAPCRLEHPQLGAVAAAGVRLVGLDYKDKPEAARRFLAELGNPFSAVGQDSSGRVGIDWGVYGVPETFVVGADGRIRYKQVGPITPEGLSAFLAEVRAAGRP